MSEEKQKKLRPCKRFGCIYHMPENSVHGCNYFAITGRTRTAQLPEGLRDPALCPLYKRGPRRRAPVQAVLPSARRKRSLGGKKGGKKFKYDWAVIRERYDAGATDKEIHNEFGVSRGVVFRWRKKNGLPANRRRPAP